MAIDLFRDTGPNAQEVALHFEPRADEEAQKALGTIVSEAIMTGHRIGEMTSESAVDLFGERSQENAGDNNVNFAPEDYQRSLRLALGRITLATRRVKRNQMLRRTAEPFSDYFEPYTYSSSRLVS